MTPLAACAAVLLAPPPAGALVAVAAASPEGPAIVVDGALDDWERIPVAAELGMATAPGGAEPGGAEPGAALGRAALVRARAAATPERVCFLLELSGEARFADLDDVTLYLDTDGDRATGLPAAGLGAELAWSPGEAEATARVLGLPVRVGPGPLGLRRAPTVSSARFEISFSRAARVAGGPLFAAGDPVAAIGVGRGADTRYTAPLVFTPAADPPRAAADAAVVAVARLGPSHLRVLTYNVLFDGLSKRTPAFARILRAVRPDVILFQEVFNHSAEETAALVREILPGDWHAAGRSGGVILSRAPIVRSGSTGSAREGVWAFLAPPDPSWPAGPLILNPHPPCCGNESGRDEEIGRAMAWLRGARGRGEVTADTPVIVAGDMNLVGWSRQLRMLLEGGGGGGAHAGDARAGAALSDAAPRHLGGHDTYTWRNDDGAFAPGRLDFILYGSERLELGRSFVLWTPELDAGTLEALGLEAGDTAVASDHLPVVADFAPRSAGATP
jgi:endonuclease/exonuclease/phosphatase (EEP) superfamily protein YafD